MNSTTKRIKEILFEEKEQKQDTGLLGIVGFLENSEKNIFTQL